MCVICVKQKGEKFPSVSSINNCAKRNPDGFAMAWYNPIKGKLEVYKAMKRDKFIAKYKSLIEKFKGVEGDVSMVIHCRISTHGSNGLKNCHCWSACKGEVVFAHNGVLHDVGNRDDMTDSETFLRDYFEPIWLSGHKDVAWRVARTVCGKSNRFAFLLSNGDIVTFGIWQTFEGNKYSNSSYEGYETRLLNWAFGTPMDRKQGVVQRLLRGGDDLPF